VDLRGRTVVLIGGSSGIGLATATAAAAAGARVVIAGRDAPRVDAAAASIPGVIGVEADVLDDAALERVFAVAGQVDHLVQLAAHTSGGRIADTPDSQLRRSLDVRLWGSIGAVRHAIPRLTTGSSITLVSGVVSARPTAGTAVAAASAGAVEALARALAVELAPVRVNAVCPGAVETPMLERALGERYDDMVATMGARLPVGRVGTAAEIADAILFLATNGYVTGEVLHVDGGHRLV
jgi:NAD(P)-dependent dehydrogenase (short-subunit alcohol dehydrogenase family)